MSYKLTDVIQHLFINKYDSIYPNEDLISKELNNEDHFDNLLRGTYNDNIVLSLPDFEYKDIKYPQKNFRFLQSINKILDDCYEGKTFYHHDIKLEDLDTGDKYKLVVNFYNSQSRSVDLELL